jgi:hypothetical protein
MEDTPLHFQETQFGFEWGPVKIERHISHKGMVVLGIKTDKVDMDFYVTKSGQVRICIPAGQSVTVVANPN